MTNPHQAAHAHRVLVVDDNADSADSLRMLLQIWGHEARCAYSAEDALKQAAEFAPQLVLLDIGLPRVNGYELAQRLRALPGTASARLVAVTGYGRPEDRAQTEQAGFDHHLVKPIEPAALETLIRQLLAGKPAS